MAVSIMQGDSFAVFLNLMQDGAVLTPDLLNELEIFVGDALRFSYSEGTVKYDSSSQQWYIWPTQKQTFDLEEGSYKVEVRVKYKDDEATSVKGYTIADRIKVVSAVSREVL